MDRYQFEDLISEYIENELSLSKRKEFESYLENNPDALELVNAIRLNIEKAGTLPKIKTSSKFNDRLLNRIKLETDERKSGLPIKGLIFGFTPIHASMMTGLLIAFVFINIQLFKPSLDMIDSKNLYTTNEELTDSVPNPSLNIQDFHKTHLADTQDDSMLTDSVNRFKKDFSKKIQFVND